jgi:hypothetical protein
MRYAPFVVCRRNERGQIVIFTLIAVLFLLAAGGLAVDFAHFFAIKYEVQRSMDAAALAGSGKLDIYPSSFGTARTYARQLALSNLSRYGTVNLNLNTANDVPSLAGQPFPYGDIILGHWDPAKPDGVGLGKRFEPTLTSAGPNSVNAVYCRYQMKIPNFLFSIWGINDLTVAAHAIATAFPPNNPPPPTQGCMVPFALSGCFFGGNTSAGCGSTISFISSSGNSEVGANSGAWVNLTPGGGNPVPGDTIDAFKTAANGTCPTSPLKIGDQLPTQNGMDEKVFNDKNDGLMELFKAKYAASSTVTVYGPPKNPSDPASPKPIYYQGKGWETFVPVIDTGAGCPPGAINGPATIVGFTRLVIAQVSDKNGECAVANHWTATQYSDGTSLPEARPNPWDGLCVKAKNGTVDAINDLPPGTAANRGIYGYFDCGVINSPPSPVPTPITALSPIHKLVK